LGAKGITLGDSEGVAVTRPAENIGPADNARPAEADQLARIVVPYIAAAVRAFGEDLWQRGDETSGKRGAGLGRRLLDRLRHRDGPDTDDPALADAVDDLLDDPDDEDAQAAVRLKVKKALRGSPEALTEIREMLAAAADHAPLNRP
jgi:hypothetical protein